MLLGTGLASVLLPRSCNSPQHSSIKSQSPVSSAHTPQSSGPATSQFYHPKKKGCNQQPLEPAGWRLASLLGFLSDARCFRTPVPFGDPFSLLLCGPPSAACRPTKAALGCFCSGHYSNTDARGAAGTGSCESGVGADCLYIGWPARVALVEHVYIYSTHSVPANTAYRAATPMKYTTQQNTQCTCPPTSSVDSGQAGGQGKGAHDWTPATRQK